MVVAVLAVGLFPYPSSAGGAGTPEPGGGTGTGHLAPSKGHFWVPRAVLWDAGSQPAQPGPRLLAQLNSSRQFLVLNDGFCWNWVLNTMLLASASILGLRFLSRSWENLFPWLFWHSVFPRLVSLYPV